jgi:hypothetical protein
MAQKSKSLFVPCHASAHFVPTRGTFFQELQVKNCKSRIASQELQVKNCKSRIAKKSLLDSLDIFSRGLMNERIFSLVDFVCQTTVTLF